MRRTLVVPLLALCLLAASPVADAGTAQRPEVADDPDDSGVPALDLRAMWFEVDDRNVTLRLRADDLPEAATDTSPCPDPGCVGLTLVFRGQFRSLTPNGTPAPALPGYQATILEYRWGWGDDDGVATAGWITADGVATVTGPIPVAVTTDGLSLTVPRNHTTLNVPDGPEPGRYRLNDTQATSVVLRCSPALAESPASCQPISRPGGGPVWDRAPDAGAGLDFVFPAPPSDDWVTVTETATATQTVTSTVTATQRLVSETVSVLVETATPFPASLRPKGLPGPGLGALALLVVAVVALRRAL
ncbi:MAG: hypothetical protein AABY18_00350 [Candidatus Thermoplasmatota archaeon]